MKTLKSVLALVFVSMLLVSCQKSFDQLAPAPEKKMAKSRDVNNVELWSKFLPVINEPYDLHLGMADSYLQVGDKPVFYVLISDMVTTDGFNGQLTLKDADSDTVYGTYDLVPFYDPSVAGITVPDDLKNTNLPFMFVRVTIPAEAFFHSIDLVANLNLVTGENNQITFQRAFFVKN